RGDSTPDSKRRDLNRYLHPVEGVRGPFPCAGNRRRLLLLARHGHGNMLVAGALVVGRVEAVTTSTANIHFRPRVTGAMLTRRHLDVPGDEPRRKTPMPGGFHHEDRKVAT